MKHLLIILISFVLLSTPVISQETGVLYQYETSSGFVFKSFGEGKIQPKYKGEITNGEPNGFGVLTYPYGEKSVVGEWKNGKVWKTKHTKKDGTSIGKFEKGEWIVSWGVLYFGFRNGNVRYDTEKWEGLESKDNKDFWKYEGEINNVVPNGHGKSTLYNGEKYEGKWSNGWMNGKGTYTWNDGRKYVGEYKSGKRDGQGTMTTLDGTKYVGGWKNGKRNGQGTFTLLDGTMYVGEYKDGFPWNGIIYDKDGNIEQKFMNGK
jgi:hypothetical protein